MTLDTGGTRANIILCPSASYSLDRKTETQFIRGSSNRWPTDLICDKVVWLSDALLAHGRTNLCSVPTQFSAYSEGAGTDIRVSNGSWTRSWGHISFRRFLWLTLCRLGSITETEYSSNLFLPVWLIRERQVAGLFFGFSRPRAASFVNKHCFSAYESLFGKGLAVCVCIVVCILFIHCTDLIFSHITIITQPWQDLCNLRMYSVLMIITTFM